MHVANRGPVVVPVSVPAPAPAVVVGIPAPSTVPERRETVPVMVDDPVRRPAEKAEESPPRAMPAPPGSEVAHRVVGMAIHTTARATPRTTGSPGSRSDPSRDDDRSHRRRCSPKSRGRRKSGHPRSRHRGPGGGPGRFRTRAMEPDRSRPPDRSRATAWPVNWAVPVAGTASSAADNRIRLVFFMSTPPEKGFANPLMHSPCQNPAQC